MRRRVLYELVADVAILLAVASIGVGCWLIAPAVAFIVVGLLLMVLAAALQVEAFKHRRRVDGARE